jgi:nicotinamide phosphoribosyltransferase
MIATGGDLAGLGFKLHDFGSRGVSSLESAGIGGAAHIVNFCGTDTIVALTTVMRYYNTMEVPAFSIPAAEHSTITAWGKENEVEAYRNMLNTYKSNGIMAVVSDSYDIFNAAEKLWGEELRQEVIDSGAIVVIRPDSGHPATVVGKLLTILDSKFGSTINEKGYKLLNHVRIIQGDGINEESIVEILLKAKSLGFCVDNLAFGMGGALLQHMDRDTMQWAMKCSAMKIGGVWHDVWKSPKGDSSKNSKRGRLMLVKRGNKYLTINESSPLPNELKTVFEDGKLVKEYTFEEVRENSNQ